MLFTDAFEDTKTYIMLNGMREMQSIEFHKFVNRGRKKTVRGILTRIRNEGKTRDIFQCVKLYKCFHEKSFTMVQNLHRSVMTA